MSQAVLPKFASKRTVQAGARLDRLRPGAFHRRVVLLIGLGMFVDACDIYLAPGVLGALVKSGWSDVATNATFLSVTFFGMLIGTLSSGFVGDRFGRRFSYQANLLLFGIASVLAAFAPNMTVLIILRFLMGIGLGAEIVVGYSSLSEFVPPSVRGRYVTMLAVITNSAVVVTGFAAVWVIPALGWRTMFAVVGVAAFAVWWMRKAMPESPRWLESRGRLEDAEAVLQRIEGEAARSGPLAPVVPSPVVPPGRFADLFGPGLRGRILVGSLINIASSVTIYGFLTWVPTFLVKSGVTLTHSLWVIAVMGLGAPFGALVGSAVADRFSRPRTIVVFTLAEAALGALYPFVGNGAEMMAVGFGLTLCTYALVATAFGLYTPELFPTSLRLRGTAVCNGFGRLSGACVQFVIASLFAAFGIGGVAAGLVGCLLVTAAVVLLFGPETSERTLEQIAADIAPSPPATMLQAAAND